MNNDNQLHRVITDGAIVVGAGVAGLAATRALRQAGIHVTLIDALSRIGGRASTVLVGSEPFDLGATWLHDADRNPLVSLADASDTLVDTSRGGAERTTVAGQPITPAEQAALDETWRQLDTMAAGPALPGSLADVIAGLHPTTWAPLVALWEGPIIAGADPSRLGAADWARNRLEGRNLVPRDGVGAFIASHLNTEAQLSTPATRISWSGPGVVVETPRGTICAAAAIITVSTGVLAAGAIVFDPPLPKAVQTAIHALPMGLLSKIALPVTAPLALSPDTTLVDRDARMSFNAQPLGRAYIAGFVGGDPAWALASDPSAFEAFARAQLARTLGPASLRSIGPAAHITDWGTNPAFLGGYAYAGPGDADQRQVLAKAFPAERLIFAGEATRSDGLAGTVGGAYLSGIEAAQRLLDTGSVSAAPAAAPAGSP